MESLPFLKWVKQSHYPHLSAKGIFNSMLLRHPDTRSTVRLHVFSDFVSDVINQHHQLLDGSKAV